MIAAITNEIHYGNDNRAADAFVDPQILHDPTIYPTPEVEARLYHSSEVPPSLERIRTRTWTRIKTAHEIEERSRASVLGELYLEHAAALGAAHQPSGREDETPTPQTIRLASALMSGLTPSFTLE